MYEFLPKLPTNLMVMSVLYELTLRNIVVFFNLKSYHIQSDHWNIEAILIVIWLFSQWTKGKLVLLLSRGTLVQRTSNLRDLKILELNEK